MGILMAGVLDQVYVPAACPLPQDLQNNYIKIKVRNVKEMRRYT